MSEKCLISNLYGNLDVDSQERKTGTPFQETLGRKESRATVAFGSPRRNHLAFLQITWAAIHRSRKLRQTWYASPPGRFTGNRYGLAKQRLFHAALHYLCFPHVALVPAPRITSNSLDEHLSSATVSDGRWRMAWQRAKATAANESSSCNRNGSRRYCSLVATRVIGTNISPSRSSSPRFSSMVSFGDRHERN